MASMMDAALDYAKKGIPVFPCDPENKAPLTPNGFKDATTDIKTIRTWWRLYPLAMIGAPMGPCSGLWLLDTDIDSAKGIDGTEAVAALIAQHGPLPKTLTALTPRNGVHYFFRWNGADIRNSASKIGPGIDIRGDGGYAILPPSEREDGTAYHWGELAEPAVAPQWLVNEALKHGEEPAPNGQGAQAAQSKSHSKPEAWAQKALDEECNSVANTPSGSRNERLNKAAYNLGQIVGGGGLDENEVVERLYRAAEDCGLVQDDGEKATRKTIDSGLESGKAQPRTRPPQQHARAGQRTTAPPAQPQPSQPPPPHGPQPQPALPVIRVIDGKLLQAVKEVENALIAARAWKIYQRGDLVVRPTKPKLKAAGERDTFAWQLARVDKVYLTAALNLAARFQRWDARCNGWVEKDCPAKVAESFLSLHGHWRIPILLSVVNTPFLRRDGSLCERPGYDLASAMLFRPEGQSFPAVPTNPSKSDAEAALEYLDDTLLAEFPFVEKIDHSVALSAIFTALDRRSMATAPLHAFTSPSPGTGKSLLVDLCAVLASGDLAPVISQGRNDEELEKRLDSALIAGDGIVSIDNCDRELASPGLCQALTQQRLRIRLLGYSRHVDTPVVSTFFATGNNLVIASDLTRRTLLCRLDAGVERPETRRFAHNVLEVAREQRGELVAAALTVLRTWHAARTVIGIEPLGSFEDWSFRVRQPLLWLNRIDPCESIVTVRDNDPGRTALMTVLIEWERVLGIAGSHSIQDVINRATVDPDFFAALVVVAGNPNGLSLSNRRLGRWLYQVEGKIVNGFKLTRDKTSSHHSFWRLIQ